jgi:hypothetical protein
MLLLGLARLGVLIDGASDLREDEERVTIEERTLES